MNNPLQRRGLKLRSFLNPLLWRGQGEAKKMLQELKTQLQ